MHCGDDDKDYILGEVDHTFDVVRSFNDYSKFLLFDYVRIGNHRFWLLNHLNGNFAKETVHNVITFGAFLWSLYNLIFELQLGVF